MFPVKNSTVLRLLLRFGFGAVVLVWSLFRGGDPQAVAVRILVLSFAVYSGAVFFRERSHGLTPALRGISAVGDILFVGILVFLTGGVRSDFHLLLYLIIALDSPFATWIQVLIVPFAGTAVYILSIMTTFNEAYWFDLAIRVSLLWLLAPLFKIVSERAVGERGHARKLASELSETHDQVRRYTAALEKANAEKEQALSEITLLHQFGTHIRPFRNYVKVYDAVLSYAHKVSEAPWIFFEHWTRSSEETHKEVRYLGDPDPLARQFVEEYSLSENPNDGSSSRIDMGDGKTASTVRFTRHGDQGSVLVLTLIFPPGTHSADEHQIGTLSALLDSVEMELELIRLQMDLEAANAELAESNRLLVRLHELKNELSGAFLLDDQLDEVINRIQEIMAKELFELDRLNLFLPDEKGEELQCRTSVGIGDYTIDDIRIPTDERGGAISMAYRTGETIFFDGRTAVPEEYRIAHPYSEIPAVRSRIFVNVPIIDHEGKVLGVIGADRKKTHRPISPETVTMLEFFAGHVAMVLTLQNRSN